MRSIKIPEKRSVGIFIRITPSNKEYLDELAEEAESSLSLIINTMVSNARAEERLAELQAAAERRRK